MVETKVADENARTRARNALPRLATVLQSLVCHLEQLSLRRVQCLHLEARHAEEGVVEHPGVLPGRECAPHGHGARAVRVGVVEATGREAGVVKLAPAVDPVLEELPQLGRAADTAGPSTS